jgi:hypothetical protein
MRKFCFVYTDVGANTCQNQENDCLKELLEEIYQLDIGKVQLDR